MVDCALRLYIYNNNLGSTKSYDYVRDHMETLATVDFVPYQNEITLEYKEGQSKSVKLHDGSMLNLHKLNAEWDPTNRKSALEQINEFKDKGEILTGLIYIDQQSTDLHSLIKTSNQPLNSLTEKDLMPSLADLELINDDHR